jgi:hypothetical protein
VQEFLIEISMGATIRSDSLPARLANFPQKNRSALDKLGGAAVVWTDGRPADCEAAIKRLLISLWLGAVVAQPAQASESEEVHSVVVDSPEVIDMSHASPDTWNTLNTLTPPIELYKQAPAPDEVELPSLRHPTYPAAFRLR